MWLVLVLLVWCQESNTYLVFNLRIAQEGIDVFNALDLMDNATMLEDLKFGPGDGLLHYYLFNWQCPQMDCSQVGLVLL